MRSNSLPVVEPLAVDCFDFLLLLLLLGAARAFDRSRLVPGANAHYFGYINAHSPLSFSRHLAPCNADTHSPVDLLKRHPSHSRPPHSHALHTRTQLHRQPTCRRHLSAAFPDYRCTSLSLLTGAHNSLLE